MSLKLFSLSNQSYTLSSLPSVIRVALVSHACPSNTSRSEPHPLNQVGDASTFTRTSGANCNPRSYPAWKLQKICKSHIFLFPGRLYSKSGNLCFPLPTKTQVMWTESVEASRHSACAVTHRAARQDSVLAQTVVTLLVALFTNPDRAEKQTLPVCSNEGTRMLGAQSLLCFL